MTYKIHPCIIHRVLGCPALAWLVVERKPEAEKDKDRVTCAVIVVMKDHFILAALAMVIFHY